jgi:hypothetical protein
MSTKTLEQQLSAERAYYLGQTDKIPGSDVPVADAKTAYREELRKYNDGIAQRRAEVAAELAPIVDTTAVTFDVTAEVSRPVVAPEQNIIGNAADTPAAGTERTREDLEKLSKAQLIAIAEEERSHQVPDSMTKSDIIDIIEGTNSPA